MERGCLVYLLRQTDDKIKDFLMLLWHQTDSAIVDNGLQAEHEVEPKKQLELAIRSMLSEFKTRLAEAWRT